MGIKVKSLFFALLLFFASCPAFGLVLNLDGVSVGVYFSPNGGAMEAIVREVDRAQSEILVQAYSFTSAPIAKAIVKAHRRGVRVSVILDKSQKGEGYSSATFFSNAGVETLIDDKHAIAHNKVMVIDGAIVITGSYNYTQAAESRNAENLLVIRSRELAEVYRKNWFAHRDHSVAFGR